LKFSIVTPSYNQAEFIARTIESVATQEGASLDHVIFDGGSTDGTVEVMRGLPQTFRWTSERDGGQADAVNKGIRASDGEIIGWLNSDDVYYPGTLAAVEAYFIAHPDVDVLYGMADHIDRDDRPFEAYPTAEFDLEHLTERCFICQPATFFRRSAVDTWGLLDDTLHFCMDYELWMRFALGGAKFGYLEQKLAGSRMYETNKTLGSRVKVHREINDMMKKRLGRVPDTWLYNYAHALVEAKIDRTANPGKFALRIGAESINAAFKWNRRISRSMLRRTAQWMGIVG